MRNKQKVRMVKENIKTLTRQHIKSVKSADKAVCEVCGREFKNQRGKNIHQSRMHN